jgi:hypothetical protein
MIAREHGRALRAPAGTVVLGLAAACFADQVGEWTRQKEKQKHQEEVEHAELAEEGNESFSGNEHDQRIDGEPYQVFGFQVIEVQVDRQRQLRVADGRFLYQELAYK